MKKKKHLRILVMIFVCLCTVALVSSGQGLYGTLSSGGPDNLGALGHYNPGTGGWNTDYYFTTLFPGSTPTSDLTEVNGKFYGMTSAGGANNVGVLFEWDPVTNVYIRKIDLMKETGSSPWGALTFHNGKLYGMTSEGGLNDVGVIFEYDPVTNIYLKKYDFDFYHGANPRGALTYHDGKFYGIANRGGNGGGVLFEWNPSSNILLGKVNLDCANGCYPQGSHSLTFMDGKFYGMSTLGGANGTGTIFEWDLTTNIYSKRIDFNCTNGCYPNGSLTYLNGKFYGQTSGSEKAGLLFEWDPMTNVITTKVEFTGNDGAANPQGSLVVYNAKLYGMTTSPNPGGAIYEFDPSTNMFTLKVILKRETGHTPYGELTMKDGKFYGMMAAGGSGYGEIFEWDPATNIYTAKIEFNTSLDGCNPQGGLVYVGNKLYGMAIQGGANNVGVIFEFDPFTKVYKKRVDLNLANGCNPVGSLTYVDGKFYGLTPRGGAYGFGTLFLWDPVTDVYTKKVDFQCSSGCVPMGSLTYHSGKLYGMTEAGWAGKIFEYNIATNVYKDKVSLGYSLGAYPRTTLTFSDGKFYGITDRGGNEDLGVIFEWDPSTNLYNKRVDLNSNTGNYPTGSLTKSGNSFYGLTNKGGITNGGVLFGWNPSTNTYVTKVNFDGSNGYLPSGTLTLSSNGKFYGATTSGGANGMGVLFEWNPVTHVFGRRVDFSRTTGSAPLNTLLAEVLDPNTLQTIDFPALPAQIVGNEPFLLTATASSGLPVSYSSSNPAVASVSGDTVTIHKEGTTIITARQPGNENFLPAADVKQTLKIYLYPDVFVLNPGNGAIDQKTSLNIKSKLVTGATTYVIQLSTTPDFSKNTITRTGDYIQHFDSLIYNMTYYAHVKTNLDPRFGRTTTFTTVVPDVYLINPKDHAINSKISGNFTSKIVANATLYTLELSKTPTFSDDVIVLTSNTYLIRRRGLEYATTYYARIKTDVLNGFGKTTSFTTIAAVTPIAASADGGISEQNESIAVSPNPFLSSMDVIVHTPDTEVVHIVIRDLQGHKLSETTTESNLQTSVGNDLKRGAYVLQVVSGKKISFYRIIKN